MGIGKQVNYRMKSQSWKVNSKSRVGLEKKLDLKKWENDEWRYEEKNKIEKLNFGKG